MFLVIVKHIRNNITLSRSQTLGERIMSSLAKCRLVCPTGSHQPVDLPHQETVIIGRSVQMRIADKKVSRQHLSLEADCCKKSVQVTQLSGNLSEIDKKPIPKGSTSLLTAGSTLYILPGSYPQQVEFTDVLEEAPRRTVGDFFSKKSESGSKRRSEPEYAKSQNKRQKTETANRMEDEEEEDDEEHLRKVQDRLAKMKNTYDKTPTPVVDKRPTPKTVPDAQGDPTGAAKWDKHDRLILHTAAGVKASSKVAAFDIDGCIITTKSGKVFPQSIADWKIQYPEINKKLKKLLAEDYKVVFFTNQMGIMRGKLKEADYKQKVEAIISELNLPIQVFIASGPGLFRKPCLGMWNFLVNHRNDGIEVDMTKSFYVGDAAGRPEKWAPGRKKDFAMSDRLFALNAGLTFHTPEEYFLGYKKATFSAPEFDPRTLPKDIAMFTPDSTKLTSKQQEVIVNVGLPGSGKSHFSRTNLVPKGYVHVSRDALGTWQKCVEATKKALKEGRSVVVDNTNVDVDSRKRYMDVAKTQRVQGRCFWFDVSIKQCRHNERFREMTDKSHQAINDMIFNQHKSKFKAPDVSEGFVEVVKVNFVPVFKDQTEESLYRQFLLEK